MNKNKYLSANNNNNNNSYHINIYIYMESFLLLLVNKYINTYIVYIIMFWEVAGNRNFVDIIGFSSVTATKKRVAYKNAGECHGE